MILKRIKKYSPWLLMIISAIMLSMVVLWPSGEKNNPKQEVDDFRQNIEFAIAETDSLLTWVSNPMFLKDPFALLGDESFSQQLAELNATIFISRSDTLLFWSDNSTPWPSDADSLYSGSIVFNGNGYYLVRTLGVGGYRIMAMDLIQSSYFYHNNYLPSRISENICDNCNLAVTFDSLSTDTMVQIAGVKQPLRLSYTDKEISYSPVQELLLVLGLFAGLILLASSLFKLISGSKFFRNKGWLRQVALLIVPVLLWRLGTFILALPVFSVLSINNPAFFAFSSRFTHLAPLLLSSFLLITWVTFFSREILLFAGRKRKQLWFRVSLLFVTFVLTASLAFFIVSGINDFLFNTSLSFNFNDILTFDARSILIFFTLFLLFCSVILLHYLMISLVSRLRLSFKVWLVVSLVFFVTTSIAAYLLGFEVGLFVPIAAWLLVMQFVFSRYFYNNKSVYLLLNLVFAAGLTTFALNNSLVQKQYDQLKLLSLNLASEQDPLTEEFLKDLMPKIESDSVLLNNPYRNNPDFTLNEYLKRRYFNGYLGQYLLQATWCGANEELIIQPADTSVRCVDYFGDVAFRLGIPTLADNVVFINDGTGRGYYLCTLRLNAPNDTSSIFVELIPASYEKGLGYPDLLVDVNSGIKSVPSQISYARFLDEKLVSRNGKFNYPTRINSLFKTMPDETVIHDAGFIHFKVTISDRLSLILTESDRDFPSFLAPFSYILLFFGLFSVLFILVTGGVFGFRFRVAASFSSRLQWMIISIILVIFFVAGVIAVYNLGSLNTSKNNEIVSEKAHSLIIELEHKLAEKEVLSFADEPYLTELALKFSRVFFTDLNIYAIDGRLLSTTRPQIFEKQLVSDLMNADAYAGLFVKNNSFLLQTESIGKMNFTSAYVPVRNENNQIIAFLNLPYFARESELNREISSFISTFINIYMLIILITVMITVVVSNYVTQPLRLIKDKLRSIKLGTTNEKIKWKRRDEIGDLVFEYNRMIEELAFKAELLARTEREMAWREMAKQVAHEIKNPLTPMKLSTQYLEKAWNDQAGDFDERLKRFSQTMVEQIDSLSDIATAFSNFGKMPESTAVKICLNDILSSVITLYRSEDYDISLHLPDKALYVLADESQMLRIFNNLLKNAQQAFVPERRGAVSVSLNTIGGKATVVMSDNGCGISAEQQKKIFQPNFTTKSSGTGLGLAMVKNIVVGFGGSIRFESKEDVGTTFTVELPLAE